MSTLFISLTKNAPYIPINKFRGFTRILNLIPVRRFQSFKNQQPIIKIIC